MYKYDKIVATIKRKNNFVIVLGKVYTRVCLSLLDSREVVCIATNAFFIATIGAIISC